MAREFSKAAKEDIAFSLLLLKDFKAQGKFDVELTQYVLDLSEALGVRTEFEQMISKIPPMEIRERKF